MDEGGFSEIVGSIYDAAASYELWPQAMDRLGQVFGCSCVSLIDRDLRTMAGRATSWGIDDDSQREFFDVWSTRNILVERTLTWSAGRIETDVDILPKAELLASDYYNGFMKPRGMHAVMRLTLSVGRGADFGCNQVLSLVRSAAAGEYEADDVEQLRHFVPHLQRASRIGGHLENAQTMLIGVTDMLERNPAGILILDHAGRIVFANRAARAMAQTKDAFVLRHERIETLRRSDDAALQALVGGATARPAPVDAPRGGALRLTRESGRAAFNVVVGPLASATSLRGGGPVAFVLITDPSEVPAPSDTMLAQLFGFSPTEIRAAERLMMGDSAEQMAAALNIRISTARWHLASLYRKTGTSRQSELVRLLSSLPIMH